MRRKWCKKRNRRQCDFFFTVKMIELYFLRRDTERRYLLYVKNLLLIFFLCPIQAFSYTVAQMLRREDLNVAQILQRPMLHCGWAIWQCRCDPLEIYSVFVAGDLAYRFCGLVVNANVAHSVEAMEDHVAPIRAVSHQVIFLIVKYQLIRGCALKGRLVKGFVKAVLVVVVLKLFSFLDRGVDHLDIVKQRLIIGLIPVVDGMNVFDVRTEMLV